MSQLVFYIFRHLNAKHFCINDKTNICNCTISWRGDGQYFAALLECGQDKGGNRKIYIFDRNCQLQSISEDGVDGLSNIVSWCPRGNLITSSQKL